MDKKEIPSNVAAATVTEYNSLKSKDLKEMISIQVWIWISVSYAVVADVNVTNFPIVLHTHTPPKDKYNPTTPNLKQLWPNVFLCLHCPDSAVKISVMEPDRNKI